MKIRSGFVSNSSSSSFIIVAGSAAALLMISEKYYKLEPINSRSYDDSEDDKVKLVRNLINKYEDVRYFEHNGDDACDWFDETGLKILKDFLNIEYVVMASY